jgi:membrane-bound inhibitor of C-type lysozyme
MRNSIKNILLLSACLSSSWAVAENGDQLQQVLYQCERGVSIPVTYLNTVGGAYAVLQVDGQQIPMSIAVSASGARYVSIDEGRNYSWHTKNDNGVLSWQPVGKPSESVVLFKECTTGTQMLAENTQ